MTQGEVGEKHLRRIARWKIIIIILFVTLIVTIAVAAAIGPIPISPIDVYKIIIQKIPFLGNLIQEPLSPVSREVVLIVRLPRVLAAALVGVALSTSGTTLQGLLRNPMADPYIIGVSAGASLGATIAMALSLGFSIFGALYAIPLAAFVGALGTVFLVYTLSRNSEGMSMLTLLLIGIAVTSFFSAIVTLIRLISSDTTLTIVFWLLGSLNLTTWNYVYLISPFVFIGFGVMLYFARDLNSIALGEDQAKHLGVETETLKEDYACLCFFDDCGCCFHQRHYRLHRPHNSSHNEASCGSRSQNLDTSICTGRSHCFDSMRHDSTNCYEPLRSPSGHNNRASRWSLLYLSPNKKEEPISLQLLSRNPIS